MTQRSSRRRAPFVAAWMAMLLVHAVGETCDELRHRFMEADGDVCLSVSDPHALCTTQRDELRAELVKKCRDRTPRAKPSFLHNMTVIIPSANRDVTFLRRTLDALARDVPASDCSTSGPLHVVIYNTGNYDNAAFDELRTLAGSLGPLEGCLSVAEWFHEYRQPFPEVPYIAEEGPDWENRRDIPAYEHVEQTYDYISILRDAFWFYPSRAYLLLEDDFEACAGATAEMSRVQQLLEDGEPSWGGVQFAYGASGWMLNRGFLRQLAAFLENNAYAHPVDLLIHQYFAATRRPAFASGRTLFQHVGNVSTFQGRHHVQFPLCGEPNSALHFRNNYMQCPYDELQSYLCDRPHASIVYEELAPRTATVDPTGALYGPPYSADRFFAAAGGSAFPGTPTGMYPGMQPQQAQQPPYFGWPQQQPPQPPSAYGNRRPVDAIQGQGAPGQPPTQPPMQPPMQPPTQPPPFAMGPMGAIHPTHHMGHHHHLR
eukprot:CAMPEP_0196782148 /NCGR_PEP_ID=MMETSP1104-20130614/10801_1 /TAXON_ID=33652 /ORGANISM="Cafeteria sp., Strain Caron Lab Isolate" /LENGTH=485 /DNA_ID=CAMNT_0042152379 /DNA_START=7 /DNA_END=1464 /DNA_ORIENTATION=-